MTSRHLAPAPTTDAPEQPPTEVFAAYARDIYADQRAGTSGVRDLLLAFAYALTLADLTNSTVMKEASKAVGREPVTLKPRYQLLIQADVPRYVGPGDETHITGTCKAARHRPYIPRDATGRARYEAATDHRNTNQICGSTGTITVTERDPATGWRILHWYCARHRTEARRVADQLTAQNAAAPEPIPNRGGLLPVYFRADWEQVYRQVAGPLWTPPSYGISADDWPTPGLVPLPEDTGRRRLRLVLPAGPPA